MNGYWASRGGRKGEYLTLRLPGHPLATGKDHLVGAHRVVLYEKVGAGPQPCHWCGKTLTWQPGGGHDAPNCITADHVDGNPRNNTPENLVPSCHGCNWGRTWKRGDRAITGAFVVSADGIRSSAEERTCRCCGTTFLHRSADKRPNRGLYCSMSCARKKSTE